MADWGRRLYLAGLPALFALALALLTLLPAAASLEQHSDETQYVWASAYFGGKAARLDFRPYGSDPLSDPGWSPDSWWAVDQPMGSRLIYALALGFSGAETPREPLIREEDAEDPARWLSAVTLSQMRLTATVCAALGLALLSWRLGWRGAAACAMLLAIPHVRQDLPRAYAEGPLLLGLGLCALAYGTRWFGVAAGVAATFKLTALGLWPLAFLCHPVGKSRFKHLLGLAVPTLVWSALTPPSWFHGGPYHLIAMVAYRILWQRQLAADYNWGIGGWFFVSRYLWPFELLLIVVALWYLPRLWRHWSAPPRVSPS